MTRIEYIKTCIIIIILFIILFFVMPCCAWGINQYIYMDATNRHPLLTDIVEINGIDEQIIITGYNQLDPDAGEIYDYIGVPYTDTYIGTKQYYFNEDDIIDVVLYNHDNREQLAESKDRLGDK